METSEKHRKAIKLGRLIIAQIEKEHQRDVLSGWMACYLSELLQKIENAEGAEKESLERTCFSTILELWDHLESLPSGYRVTKDYDDVLNTLEAISPKAQGHFYGLDPLHGITNKNKNSEIIRDQLGLILSIDQLARNMIAHILDDLGEVLEAKDNVKAVEAVKELFPTPHSRALARLMGMRDDREQEPSLHESALSNTDKLIQLAEAYRGILKDRIRHAPEGD